MSTRFGIFAKHWTPGLVKTRLAAAIGTERAASLHFAFLTTLLRRFSDIGDRRWLFYSPSQQADAFAELAGRNSAANPESAAASWGIRPQSDGDLGKRMESYFRTGFEEGDQQVCLIGADSPNLPREYVLRAFAELESTPVVLGPSRDGGYYLIAARDRVPPVFEGVSWGGEEVLADTLEHLERSGVGYALLPTWYDVDVWHDVEQLAADLNADRSQALNAGEGEGRFDDALAQLRTTVNALLAEQDRNPANDFPASDRKTGEHDA